MRSFRMNRVVSRLEADVCQAEGLNFDFELLIAHECGTTVRWTQFRTQNRKILGDSDQAS